jgi:hypothetical protein
MNSKTILDISLIIAAIICLFPAIGEQDRLLTFTHWSLAPGHIIEQHRQSGYQKEWLTRGVFSSTVVRYKYRAQDEMYEGTEESWPYLIVFDWLPNRVKAHFPQGAPVIINYNPINPSQSAFLPAVVKFMFLMLYQGLAVFGVILAMMLFVHFKHKESQQ